jgi:CRISPR-associated protein Cmr3
VRTANAAVQFPGLSKPNAETHGLILTLLTHADLDFHWYPPGFEVLEQQGVTVWRSVISGVMLTIHAAALGKAHREGGWDLVAHQSRAVKSLIPAGSAWYCTVEGQLESAIRALHGTQIGEEQALGRGLLAVGLWTKDKNLEQGALP